MQNDFLPKHIFPKCFKYIFSKISMEAKTKENFYQKQHSFSFRNFFALIHFHYTLVLRNIQQKMKIFLHGKRKKYTRQKFSTGILAKIPQVIKMICGIFNYDDFLLRKLHISYRTFYSVTIVTDFIFCSLPLIFFPPSFYTIYCV